MSANGTFGWVQPFKDPWIGGRQLVDCYGEIAMTYPPAVQRMPSALGTAGVQRVTWIGGDQPVSLVPALAAASIEVSDEDDARWIERSASLLLPWVLGLTTEDVWVAAAGNGTTWRSSRGLWLGSPVDLTTYRPRVWTFTDGTDETELTVITTGSPGAGEALIPTTPTSEPWDLETAALSSGYLAARYYAQTRWRAQIESTVEDGREAVITYGLTLEEILTGEYTGL